MSERKVLNKYYPPDFDPTKLPKLKQGRNRQFVIRIMAPFSMRCKTCGEYIYKGRKFNSRMETVENETYLGLRIYRFYIRCTKCISEITFKTDPENTDYLMEHGATRLFEAFKRLGEQIAKEKQDKEDEEANNPMKALENRTRDSKREMESIEKLEELKDLNQRAASIDPEKLIKNHLKEEERLLKIQEEQDEQLVRQMFGGGSTSVDGYVNRIIDNSDDSDHSDDEKKLKKFYNPTDILTATDILTENDITGDDVPGPSKKPVRKTKLKAPLDDLSSMIRLKKSKPNETDGEVKTTSEKKDDKQSLKETSTDSTSNVIEEIAPLPTYKLTLKKNKSECKEMKGTSLNMLGGYDSNSSSNDEGE